MTIGAMLSELEAALALYRAYAFVQHDSYEAEGRAAQAFETAAENFVIERGPALAEAVRDAERYRWLRSEGINFYATGIMPGIIWQGPDWLDIDGPERLDKAIDEARLK